MRRADAREDPRLTGAVTCAILLTCLTVREGALCVALLARGSRGWALPSAPVDDREPLDAIAMSLRRRVLSDRPALSEQVRAFSHRASRAEAAVLVGYVAAFHEGDHPLEGLALHDVERLPRTLSPSSRDAITAATAYIGMRASHTSVAFSMLPPRFTLRELQLVYEVLLGRSVYRASFRRALKAARAVRATASWRQEGRGRPAQLYQFASKPGNHGALRLP